MILKKKINFAKFEIFNSKKISANAANTAYTQGLGGELMIGEPDIMWQTICFIKDVQKIWTGGLIYGGIIGDFVTRDELLNILESTDSDEASEEAEADLYNSALRNTPLYLTEEEKSIVRNNIGISQADWNQTDSKAVDYIINKPDLNTKQDIISDLETIRTGAEAGATAVLPSAINDMETKTHASLTYQPVGNYLTEHLNISEYIKNTFGIVIQDNKICQIIND